MLAAACAAAWLGCRPEAPPPSTVPFEHPVADAATAAATDAAAHPPPVASITRAFGEPQGSYLTNAVVTSTDVPNAEDVILGARPAFKRCYEATRSGGPHFGGMVTCSMRVDKDGNVVGVSVTRRDRLPNPLVDCLIAALKSAKFGRLEQDKMVVVPIRFEGPDD